MSRNLDLVRSIYAESPEIQRQPIRLEHRPRRHLDERLSLRFPRVRVALTRATLRFPPRSRIRRLVLSRAVAWHCDDRVVRDGNSTVVF